MEFDSRTATAAGQISTSTKRVRSIEFHARSDNESSAVAGVSDVSNTNGREIPPGESVTYNFDEGSVSLSIFYCYLEAGDKLDWSVIIR